MTVDSMLWGLRHKSIRGSSPSAFDGQLKIAVMKLTCNYESDIFSTMALVECFALRVSGTRGAGESSKEGKHCWRVTIKPLSAIFRKPNK